MLYLEKKMKRAFTLLELFIVVAIASILVALILPFVQDYVKQQRSDKNMAEKLLEPTTIIVEKHLFYNVQPGFPGELKPLFILFNPIAKTYSYKIVDIDTYMKSKRWFEASSTSELPAEAN